MKRNQKTRRASVLFTLAALVVVLLNICSTPVRAAEITLNWRMMTGSNMNSDSSKIYDMEFMPGQESFIIVTGSSLQVRDCEDGSIIKSVSIPYIGAAHNIEFTPDSTKLILAYADQIEMREIENFTIINSYTIPKDEEEFSVRFIEMKVDPIRPFIYLIQNRQKYVNGNLVIYRKILIFNSETLEPVGELMPQTGLLLSNIAVSKDGKYLAVMNAGYTSKLMVWSLDTRQQIIDKQIGNSGKEWSDPADVKFSEINTDKLFFTGKFYQDFGKETFNGLCIFSINENSIIDSSLALTKENYAGQINIVFFENEQKILGMSNGDLRILDMVKMKKIFDESVIDSTLPYAYIAIYSHVSKFFIGTSFISMAKFQYQPNTSVPLDNKKDVIYPNPTTGLVNLPIHCNNSNKFEIYNTNGKLLQSTDILGLSNNLLTIDFTDYSKGLYLVNIYCGKDVLKFQVVKGE